MTLPLVSAPSIVRHLLLQWPGVQFVEREVDSSATYKIFDADLSACVALAGADALRYVELQNAAARVTDRIARLQEFVASPLHGRTIVVELDTSMLQAMPR